MTRRLAWLVCFAVGCGGGEKLPKVLGPLSAAPLSTEQTVTLVHPMEESAFNPADPAGLQQLLAAGFGETSVGPGAAIASHTLDGSAAPAPSATPTLLTRFAHIADTQLADDESPTRLVNADNRGPTNAAYRPHEAWVCLMLRAAVRTINKVHEATPIEFTLVGGDNSDNAQHNEVAWFMAILDGAPRIECDSGRDDDPVKGAENDPKDPFSSVGLAMRWLWVTGNHDVENEGTLPIEGKESAYVGDYAAVGTRDWSQPGAPTITDGVVPDPERRALPRKTLMAEVAAAGDGHGITATNRASGFANYFYDVAGGKLRIVVVDAAAETGGSDGVMHRATMMNELKPMLDEAEAAGKWIIVTSHQSGGSLSDGGDFGGTAQPDAVLGDEWRTFLAGYPHLLMHLAGHSHHFHLTVTQPAAGHPYYEVETASLADWPCQFRLFEVWEHQAHILVRAIPVDYSLEGDPLLVEARRRAAADFDGGWLDVIAGPGAPDARAMDLWFPKP